MSRGKRLRTLRRKSGLTLRQVEEYGIGKSYSQIGVYERDDTVEIHIEVLKKLATLYKTTVDYIENGISPKSEQDSGNNQFSPTQLKNPVGQSNKERYIQRIEANKEAKLKMLDVLTKEIEEDLIRLEIKKQMKEGLENDLGLS